MSLINKTQNPKTRPTHLKDCYVEFTNDDPPYSAGTPKDTLRQHIKASSCVEMIFCGFFTSLCTIACCECCAEQ